MTALAVVRPESFDAPAICYAAILCSVRNPINGTSRLVLRTSGLLTGSVILILKKGLVKRVGNKTKEQIAEEALRLFSRYGYSAVSIRRICRAVDIKESTVYYHYANKQAILDALLERVDRIAAEKQLRFDAELAKTEYVSEEAMAYVANHLLDDYLLHPSIYPLICVLSMERMHDEAAEKKYKHIVFDMPISQQKKVFRELADRKMIIPNAEEQIAELYYGVIFSVFSELCLGKDRTEKCMEAAHTRIEKAIRKLYSMIRI